MDAAKNTDYIKTFFKQKIYRIAFPTNNSLDTYLYRGLQRLPFSKYYNVLECEGRLTLGVDATKKAAYIKKFFKQKLLRKDISYIPICRNQNNHNNISITFHYASYTSDGCLSTYFEESYSFF